MNINRAQGCSKTSKESTGCRLFAPSWYCRFLQWHRRLCFFALGLHPIDDRSLINFCRGGGHKEDGPRASWGVSGTRWGLSSNWPQIRLQGFRADSVGAARPSWPWWRRAGVRKARGRRNRAGARGKGLRQFSGVRRVGAARRVTDGDDCVLGMASCILRPRASTCRHSGILCE